MTFFHVVALIPYFHKVKNMGQMILVFVVLSILMIIVSAPFTPYTNNAPKQVYIDHWVHNPFVSNHQVTPTESVLWIRSADSVLKLL